jgi:hypothetical protein
LDEEWQLAKCPNKVGEEAPSIGPEAPKGKATEQHEARKIHQQGKMHQDSKSVGLESSGSKVIDVDEVDSDISERQLPQAGSGLIRFRHDVVKEKLGRANVDPNSDLPSIHGMKGVIPRYQSHQDRRKRWCNGR